MTATDTTSASNTAEGMTRRVLAQFVPYGWGEADRLLAFANKTYSTAVGDKDATVWVRVNEAEGLCILTGDYLSEGRNALSTCWVTFPVDAGEDEIADAVARFAEMADEQVGDTYAMRLTAPRG
jgi:hypothetical protein